MMVRYTTWHADGKIGTLNLSFGILISILTLVYQS